MSNRFKARKKIPLFKYIKNTFIITFFIIVILQLFKFFFLFITNENTKKALFNYVMIDYDHYNQNIINKAIAHTSSNIVNNPIKIIETYIPYEWNDDINGNLIDNYIDNPNENIDVKEIEPLIYIYNSHQSEKYIRTNEEQDPTVLLAAYKLQKSLSDQNINSIVEEQNITEFMRINNMQYHQSYEASRYYLKDTIEKYPTIKLYIDLHRDAGIHDNYTISINNEKYAKVMFIVGKENPNHAENKNIMATLSNHLNEQYPGISKGIIEKEGEGVNGVYNQDISSNVILIELGCNENNMLEITNTIEILSKVIGDYVNG